MPPPAGSRSRENNQSPAVYYSTRGSPSKQTGIASQGQPGKAPSIASKQYPGPKGTPPPLFLLSPLWDEPRLPALSVSPPPSPCNVVSSTLPGSREQALSHAHQQQQHKLSASQAQDSSSRPKDRWARACWSTRPVPASAC